MLLEGVYLGCLTLGPFLNLILMKIRSLAFVSICFRGLLRALINFYLKHRNTLVCSWMDYFSFDYMH